MNEQETKRTIDEVLDSETGEIIKSDIFFQKPESEIIAYRRRLQEAIAGFEPPKFRCAYCNQLLKLSGKSTRRGQVSFFSHLYDSEDCEIKTNDDLSKEEIEARKYGNVGESERHIQLKNKLAYYLKSTSAVSNVEIEKRLTSEVPYLYWRRPDVYAEYNGKIIVFELQLSTTFLSVIIERDIFYRVNNIFIVWVFNFSDNKEYVNFQNLMIKDIYYANKRNAFVFDEIAQQLSKETGELHLLCIWFEPLIINGEFQHNEGIRKEEYIKLSDLKFDNTSYKPYYVDADALYSEYQSGYFESKIDFENLQKLRLEKIAKKNKEREHIQLLNEQKIVEKKEQIIQGASKLTLFQKGIKWGYEADGIEIIKPKYTDVTDFSNSDYAKVKYNRKYGFINKIGEFVFDPIFIEAFNISNNKCIGKYEKDWCIIDLQNKSSLRIECFDIVKLTDNLLRVTHRFTKKIFSGVNNGGYNTYSNQHTDTFSIFSMEGNEIKKCLHYKVYKLNSGRLISKIKEYYLCFDDNGNKRSIKEDEKEFINIIHTGIIDNNDNIIIPFEYESIEDFIDGKAKAKKNGKCGYIDEQGQTLIPFEYDSIEDFIDGKAKAKKNGKYGCIDEQGQTLIPFEHDLIEDFIDGKAKAKKHGKYGYIDEQGQALIPFEHDSIEDFIDGKAKAKKNGKYGYIDEQGQALIPFEYDFIEDFIHGKAKAKKNGKCGYIDKQGQTLIPFEYNSIEDFIDGKAKGEKNGKYGYIDEQGQTLIPFEYDSIKDFIDGKAKVRKNNKEGYIDINGIELIQNVQIVKDKTKKGEKFGKWGVESLEGYLIIPFEYESIEDFIDGKAKAKKNGKYGYINEQGQSLIPFEYDSIEDFIAGKGKAKKDGEFALIDGNGNGIIIFKEIKMSKGKYGETITEYLYGIKDTKENIILIPEYNKIGEYKNGLAKIYADKKYIGGGKFSPKFKYKVGYVDETGKIAAPCVFDEISEFVDGKAKAKKNGEILVIDIYRYEVERKTVDIGLFKINSIHSGKIINVVKFGLFVKLGNGITALLHISELNRHKQSSTNYIKGQELEVQIISIDVIWNRISLTLPQNEK